MNSRQEKENLKSKGLEAAKYDALKLLSYRSRTVSELANRLALKGYNDKVIKKVLAHFESLGLLDDRKWADDRMSYYLQRGYGRIGIKHALQVKGINKNMAETALESLSIDTEIEAGLKFIKKKYGFHFDLKTKKRAFEALRRRGFSSEAIKVVLKKVNERNQYCNEKQ